MSKGGSARLPLRRSTLSTSSDCTTRLRRPRLRSWGSRSSPPPSPPSPALLEIGGSFQLHRLSPSTSNCVTPCCLPDSFISLSPYPSLSLAISPSPGHTLPCCLRRIVLPHLGLSPMTCLHIGVLSILYFLLANCLANCLANLTSSCTMTCDDCNHSHMRLGRGE